MSHIRPIRELRVLCRVDQFINDSIHLENDVFENLPTARRNLPLIAVALKGRQTQKQRRHGVFEIVGKPLRMSGATFSNGWVRHLSLRPRWRVL